MGTARGLLERATEAAGGLGARELIGSHATEAGSRFTARAGAVDSQREIRSLLRLPAEGSAAAVPGYELESWVGAAPERLLDSFARAREAINDAPVASDEDIAVWDGERVRDLEAALERRDRDIRVTVAVDGHGEVVAFTELRVSRGPEPPREHGGHRGRRRAPPDEASAAGSSSSPCSGCTPTGPEVEARHDRQRGAERGRCGSLNRSLGFAPVCVHTSCVLELQG